MKVDVILPAAGTGERMNLPVAKQFVKVLGKHILAYTVDCFYRFSWIRHIVVVVSADQCEFTSDLMNSYGFSRVIVCVGSHSRHRSILCGLKALEAECSCSDVVVIHDAARPFVSEEVTRQIVEAAKLHGAAGVTRPLVSTVIRQGDDGRLLESLDRTFYRNSEMPQAFHYSVIMTAYKQCSEGDLDHGTECLLLALKYSLCPAVLVEGNDDLWKVTYQKDIYLMESIVKEKFMVVSVINICSREFMALEEFQHRLCKGQIKIAENQDVPANTFVVVQDYPSGQAIGDVAVKVSSLYERDRQLSAIRLDLMVVIVFLKDSHLSCSQSCVLSDWDVTTAGQNLHKPDECQRDSGFCSKTQHSCTSDHYVTAQYNNSDMHGTIQGVSTLSSQDFVHQDNSVKVAPSGPNLPGELDQCRNDCDSTFVNMLSFVPSSHLEKTIDLSFQPEDPIHGSVQESPKDVTYCKTAVKAMKDALRQGTGGKFAITVGVISTAQSAIGEQLAELVWQRSLCMDNQVLIFDGVQ